MILHNVDKHVITEKYLPAVSFSNGSGHSPHGSFLDGVMKVTVENHDKVAIS